MNTRVLLIGVVSLVSLTTGCHRGSKTARESETGTRTKRAGDDASKAGYSNKVTTSSFRLDTAERRELLALARRTVETYVRKREVIEPPADLLDRFPNLKEKRACFVTLRERQERLRGCIGSLRPYRPLVEDIIHNAVAAATQDPRFSQVSERELADLSYSISVLDIPRPLEGVAAADLPAYMEKHRPGVVLTWRGRRSTFLPSVWEELPDPVQFLSHLCRKQGSPSGCWKSPDVEIQVYGSIHFSEKDMSR